MLLDPVSLDLDLVPRTCSAAARERRALSSQELPAAQLEIVLPPAGTVAETGRGPCRSPAGHWPRAPTAIGAARGCRCRIRSRRRGHAQSGRALRAIEREFGSVARRQLVFGLHVHVAVPGAGLALAVYNAVREHLPALAALGAGLALPRGRRQRPGVGPSDDLDPAPAPGDPAGVRVVAGVRRCPRLGGRERSVPRCRAVVVGGTPAPAARDAGDPRPRYAEHRRRYGRARGGVPRARRLGSPSGSRAARSVRPRRAGASPRTGGRRVATAPPAPGTTFGPAALSRWPTISTPCSTISRPPPACWAASANCARPRSVTRPAGGVGARRRRHSRRPRPRRILADRFAG